MSQTNVTKTKKKEGEKQMKNNKGFSLVELIIVIAIMAILVGVMAPQLIKYIEKTNVSADTQLADSLKTAITTTIMDPAVINKNATQCSTVTGNTSWVSVTTTSLPGSSADATTVYGGVAEILGFEPTNSNLVGKLKSSHASNASFEYKAVNGNTVAVRITTTDITGKKNTSNASNYIVVGE